LINTQETSPNQSHGTGHTTLTTSKTGSVREASG